MAVVVAVEYIMVELQEVVEQEEVVMDLMLLQE